MKKLSQKEFLDRVTKINPHLDFSKTVYNGKRENIIVTCPIHGDFIIKAGSAEKYLTCPECDLEKRKQEFIDKATTIHNNKYDYSKVDYKTNKIPVEIICPIHGSFMQAPGDHLKGYGCSKCSKKYKPSTEEWIDKVQNWYPYFDLSKVQYKDNKTPVIIKCKRHNCEFQVLPNNVKQNMLLCPECRKEYKQKTQSKDLQLFIEQANKIHFNKYDYSKTVYINNKIPVKIICPIHGEFEQTPSSHLDGYGCHKCKNKNQTKIFNILKEKFPNEIIEYEYSPTWLGTQRFDIYFPKYNIAVEYDGQQHFVPIKWFGGDLTLQKVQERDLLKNQKCKDNNCILFRIKYDYTEETIDNLVQNITQLMQE